MVMRLDRFPTDGLDFTSMIDHSCDVSMMSGVQDQSYIDPDLTDSNNTASGQKDTSDTTTCIKYMAVWQTYECKWII